MVVYFGMSDKLKNHSYYDSTGNEYGFTKPYSEERAKIIDEEVSRIIEEQYERAKQILTKYAKGHRELTELLLTREVIYTEDAERIFGKRPWVSRTEEILELNKKDEEISAAQVPASGDASASTGQQTGTEQEDKKTEEK